ncbi:MAG: PspC domain-containing protein [Candidatus Vogelbacteria bacterium RIFOXYD1_FULL_46_19]|uniref:PspC domain-containing protein n=1 Tax=Candidatus Vogelbacteria bacterium RIFOXYD1_FULL_46_19 TaxID=1802439 RepID=A0A1G2QJB1_9BACT|nr:MAG: PspC domain-containing protein [Candidatus Vogelbacteria bacterium RIFOXYD1_FULL_46_19]
MKKLYRSQKDRTVAGVLGGLGEYSSIDPVLLRVIFILIVLMTGIFPGVIGYLLAILIVPQGPDSTVTSTEASA